MSFTYEAAPSVPPVGRHFDFAKHLRDARGLLVKRVLPNLRDASVFTYKKASATGVLLASPFFWLEEHAGSSFDERVYPKPPKVVKGTEERGPVSRYGVPILTAAAFMAVLFAPGNFTSRATDQEEGAVHNFVSQSDAATNAQADTYVAWNSAERRANGLRLNREYWARRGERLAPVASSDVPAERRQIGPMQVSTGFFTEDEFGTQ